MSMAAMVMGRQIDDRHWVLWALRARQRPGAEIGFPRKQNFYMEGISSGYREVQLSDLLGDVTPDDEDIADCIGRAVEELGKWRAKWRLVLIAWWNAFPGGKDQCQERCKQIGVSWGLVYDRRDEARAWCEAYVEWMHKQW